MPANDRQHPIARPGSPDNLDQLMTVVTSKDWIPLVTIALLLAGGTVWSVLGSVPTAVEGRGVLLRPRRTIAVENLAGGRLAWFRTRAGDAVRRGDVIARLDQAELRQQIQEQRTLLAALESQDRLKTASEDRQVGLQEHQNQLERKSLEAQRESHRRALADAEAVHPLLEKRVKVVQELKGQGLMAEAGADFTTAHINYLENDAKISGLRAQGEQIDSQLHALETVLSSLKKQNLEAAAARRNEILVLKSKISAGELQLRNNGDIVSSYSGRVLEVFASEGQVLASGSRLLSLTIQDAESPLLSISYFAAKDGKKIQPGMPVQVTPDSVERSRFGGIVGRVISVSPQPVTREGAVSTVGNVDLIQGLIGPGAWVEVTSQLQHDKSSFSGYRWSSSRGPQLGMSPGITTVARVTVESRTPASYVIPSLREASDIY